MNTASETAWRLLEVAAQKDFTVRESDVSVAAGPALHALDPQGLRHLMLPLAPDAPGLADDRSRGVTVATRTLLRPEGGAEDRYIDIKCEDSRLKDLFSIVCDEVLHHCVMNPDAPNQVTSTVLERWRDLLGPASRRLLSDSQVRGLLAELHMLESIAAISPTQAVGLWTGPDGTRHDFTGIHASCEVKASVVLDEVRVHINGLRQLEPPPTGLLYLVVERMEQVPADGDSIPFAVERLVGMGVDRVALMEALLKSGVAAADMTVYASMSYRVLECRAYCIDQDFPRLVPLVLEGGPAEDRISSVEYVLNLGSQPPTPLGDVQCDAIPQVLTAAGPTS